MIKRFGIILYLINITKNTYEDLCSRRICMLEFRICDCPLNKR